jgi:PTS system nitrogen regulatory IIA component
MKMQDLLSIDGIIPSLSARDRRDALRKLAAHAANNPAVREASIDPAAMECAELPALGLGAGVSLFHAFVRGILHPVLTFARLERPLDFGASDGSPTDLVALLLSPAESTGDHLQALACTARTLRDQKLRDLSRAAESRDALYVILCGGEEQLLPGALASGRRAFP